MRKPGTRHARDARLPQAGAVRPEVPSQLFDWPRALGCSAAITFCVLLPVVMVVSNKSAPVPLGVGALLANLSVILAGRRGELLQRYRAVLWTVSGALLTFLLVWSALSFTWTISVPMTARGLREMLPEIVFGWGASAAWPMAARRSDLKLLGLGIALAGLLIVFEAVTKMPLHQLVGTRALPFDLKRSSIPPLLLLWPAFALCHRDRQYYSAASLVIFAEIGAIVSHSSASIVAVLVGGAVYTANFYAPRLALWGYAAIMTIGLFIAPWTGTFMTHLLPPRIETLLEEQHAKERVAIWTAFEQRVLERPWLGHGFDASFRVADAAGTPAGRPGEEAILGIHPHNQLLQVWIDFGAVGAAAILAMIAHLTVSLRRLTPHACAPRLAFLASATVMGLVGVQAWDPWWLATIAVTWVIFTVLRRYDHGDLDASHQSARG